MRNQAKTGHPTWKENRGSSFATHSWHCLCVDGLRHRTSQLDLITRLHYVFNNVSSRKRNTFVRFIWPTKTLIDVGLERLGIATGAGIVLLAAVIAPDDLQIVLLSVAVVVALVSLFLCSRLHGGYVDALAESLRAGSVELSENMVMDRTTMHTLSHTATVLDREKLLRDIEAMRVQRDVVEGPKLGPSMQDPTVEAIRDLRSGDANRVRKRLLHGAGLEPHYVSHVIDLLADKTYLTEVSAVLFQGVSNSVSSTDFDDLRLTNQDLRS